MLQEKRVRARWLCGRLYDRWAKLGGVVDVMDAGTGIMILVDEDAVGGTLAYEKIQGHVQRGIIDIVGIEGHEWEDADGTKRDATALWLADADRPAPTKWGVPQDTVHALIQDAVVDTMRWGEAAGEWKRFDVFCEEASDDRILLSFDEWNTEDGSPAIGQTFFEFVSDALYKAFGIDLEIVDVDKTYVEAKVTLPFSEA